MAHGLTRRLAALGGFLVMMAGADAMQAQATRTTPRRTPTPRRPPTAAPTRRAKPAPPPRATATPVEPRVAAPPPVATPTAAAPSTTGTARPVSPVSRPVPTPAASVHLLSIESYVVSRVDDNVNRDPIGVTSIGMIGGGTMRYTSSALRPVLSAEYDVAMHRYTTTTRFDRISQRARVALSKRVVKWWTVDLLTEVALRGSGEDRDVSDQFLLLPQTTFRISDGQRVRFAAAQRWRRFPTDSLQNAANRFLLAEYRRRFRAGDEFEAEARVEENAALGSRFDFQRSSLALSYTMPVTRAITLEAGMQYRRQRYAGRFVDIGATEVARVDHRLEPSAELRLRLGASEVLVAYEPEWRRSNDPDKVISQNLWQVGVRRRWF